MHRTEPYLKTAPTITCANAEQAKSYCLMMIDPDAPSRADPTYAPIRHWYMHACPILRVVVVVVCFFVYIYIFLLKFQIYAYSRFAYWASLTTQLYACRLVGNIPGSELQKGFEVDSTSGKVLSGYHPPGPPENTGFHRSHLNSN